MKTTIKGQSSDTENNFSSDVLTVEKRRSSSPNIPTNIPVEKDNTGNRRDELYYRDLVNQLTQDGETLTAAALFGHFTTDQAGKFLNDFSTKGFAHAYLIAMTTDQWKDDDQIELLFTIVKDSSALLASMIKDHRLKGMAKARLITTVEEVFKPTQNKFILCKD